MPTSPLLKEGAARCTYQLRPASHITFSSLTGICLSEKGTFPLLARTLARIRARGHVGLITPVFLPEEEQSPWVLHQGCQLSLLQDILILLFHILGPPDLF